MGDFQTHISKCSESKTKLLDFFFHGGIRNYSFERARIFKYGLLKIFWVGKGQQTPGGGGTVGWGVNKDDDTHTWRKIWFVLGICLYRQRRQIGFEIVMQFSSFSFPSKYARESNNPTFLVHSLFKTRLFGHTVLRLGMLDGSILSETEMRGGKNTKTKSASGGTSTLFSGAITYYFLDRQ